jgi:Fic family protein
MARTTGSYSITEAGGEEVRAFLPRPLPPQDPTLVLEGKSARLHEEAVSALGRLEVAGTMVPSAQWFLYGFVRKEAVISSQIEGTEASLMDIVAFEATNRSERPAAVEEVCNYVEALAYARAEVAKPKGLPLCTRLLCEAHRRLMRGVRGAERKPGTIRTSQNWGGLLRSPLLYLSLSFKRHREDYYRSLSAVRTEGDWEGWTEFFLACVREAADDGVEAARRLSEVLARDRRKVAALDMTTVSAVRLLDLLPEHPMVTLPSTMELLDTTKPTAGKALDALVRAGILHETTGRKRYRVYAYQAYLKVLAEDTAVPG